MPKPFEPEKLEKRIVECLNAINTAARCACGAGSKNLFKDIKHDVTFGDEWYAANVSYHVKEDRDYIVAFDVDLGQWHMSHLSTFVRIYNFFCQAYGGSKFSGDDEKVIIHTFARLCGTVNDLGSDSNWKVSDFNY